MNAIQQAEQAGFDMSLIDESLRLTHEQRALQHQEALNLALTLEVAGRQLHEEQDASKAEGHPCGTPLSDRSTSFDC